MTTLEQAAQAVLDRWDSPAWEWVAHGPTAALMADLRDALAAHRQAEPVAIPGAIPMSKVVARSRAMPERADALERARQRLEQAEPVQGLLRDALEHLRSLPWESGTGGKKRGETHQDYMDRMSSVEERNNVRRDLIEAIEQQLAEPAVADRVGYSIGGAKWLHQWSNRDEEETANQWKKGYNAARDLVRIMLDTPQQAEPVAWVGLTDGEAEQTFAKHDCNISTHLAGILARAIEAALKQKNAQQAEPVVEPDDASGNPSY